MFFVFEGMDGAGKTTCRDGVAKRLREMGYDVVVCREPGGTLIGEQIRDLLLFDESKYYQKLSESSRVLLFNASRSEHLEHVIKPSVEAGKIVLVDRWVYSTIAYTENESNRWAAANIHNEVIGDYECDPDHVFFLDIDKESAKERLMECNDGKLDDIEKRILEDFDTHRERYEWAFKCLPVDHSVLDGTDTIENLQDIVLTKILQVIENEAGRTPR
ncbi:thymidylate kinase [Serratia phage Moabite]|uniref:dTMP kinase n=3 Tax=Moabitevirus TaxID=2843422 RepID=A0A7T3NBN6_9CAUD|nr:thymidylate kinase [Serratia phage vB_SmaM_ 2050HW]YP_009849234.1 thymidylate kinase [Serratia phage Moabite]QPX76683.1 putative thymidylate kinase [Serratia phage vB_SmaM_Yaphecito]UQT03534.1 dTMP kinase [Serratia phage vB_SmaM-Kodama]URG14239.1 thymidine kinase [Pectobacterium phage vB_ParM-25]ATA65389.1 thymidylate kinase [Serratia phage vB_SmaM_ 2050HW]QDB71170.1 thymidylate kinase [Serratia phage Moabite]